MSHIGNQGIMIGAGIVLLLYSFTLIGVLGTLDLRSSCLTVVEFSISSIL